MRSHVALVLLAAAAACDPAPAPPVGIERAPIIGGTLDPADPAVAMLDTAGGGCTGTLVSPRVILTAAHCVSFPIQNDLTDRGSVRFGSGGAAGFEHTVGVADMVMYRLYEPPAFLQYDIAMIRLEGPAPASIEPMPINFQPLSDDDIGLPVKTVGFGVTDGATQEGFGTKRKVALTVDDVTAFHVRLGDASFNICQGDSGGPTFAELGGEERVIGVASFGSDQCRSTSSITRTDIYQAWIGTVMAAWDGPCQQDGTCVEDCATPDPDCDVCGFDGVCGTDCPAPDLDCPLGKRVGADCAGDGECEGRRCLAAPDVPEISYCSEVCDPARPDACTPPLGACVDHDGEYLCEYSGQTPGTPGAACDGGDDCRSGACDEVDDICVEACAADGSCAEGLTCRSGYCRLPADEGGGCGCRAGGVGAAPLALLLVGFLGLRRRRRRSNAAVGE